MSLPNATGRKDIRTSGGNTWTRRWKRKEIWYKSDTYCVLNTITPTLGNDFWGGVGIRKSFLKIIFFWLYSKYRPLIFQNHFGRMFHFGTSHTSKSLTFRPPNSFPKDECWDFKIISHADCYPFKIISLKICVWRPCTSTRVSKIILWFWDGLSMFEHKLLALCPSQPVATQFDQFESFWRCLLPLAVLPAMALVLAEQLDGTEMPPHPPQMCRIHPWSFSANKIK